MRVLYKRPVSYSLSAASKYLERSGIAGTLTSVDNLHFAPDVQVLIQGNVT